LVVSAAVAWASGGLWTSGGQDIQNTRHADTEAKISPDNVGDLVPKWVFETGGDVSATPAVDGTTVYVPDWAGNLFAIDRKTGEAVWTRQVSEYAGPAGNFARATPAVAGDRLILGDQGGRLFAGATVFAIDKHTGDLLWSTKVDEHPAAIVTQSAVVHGNIAYVGVASLEEGFALDPGYPCCTFRGSLVALDVRTGKIVWKTYMAPEGFSGNAVWGPTPSIDPSRGAIYVATGNNYTVPQEVLVCVADNEGDPDAVSACIPADNHFDSILSLDLKTGAINWAVRALPFDAWTLACIFGPEENCTSPSGPDLDFGEGPALFTIGEGSNKLDVVGAGQKSGQYWVLDRDTGAIIWLTRTGPGGLLGGMIWGSAVDGERIYTANANSSFEPWTLVGGSTVNSGFWTAMDADTGEILWQTADPEGFINQGPVAVANGVVYGCSLDVDGHMYALDAATGEVLWSFESGGSCNAGAAIVNGTVYWGSGYSSLGGFFGSTGNNKLFAFEPGS
jgi:polyvinyl alcohol dehydrogenase (cytochrome)